MRSGTSPAKCTADANRVGAVTTTGTFSEYPIPIPNTPRRVRLFGRKIDCRVRTGLARNGSWLLW
jgi:hypothetical protein